MLTIYHIRVNKNENDESYGMLYIADIYSFEEIHSEIEKIIFTDELGDDLQIIFRILWDITK